MPGGKTISRKIGFFIQMDRVIKFLVGANHARKWERHFALSVKKNVPVQQSRTPAVTSAC